MRTRGRHTKAARVMLGAAAVAAALWFAAALVVRSGPVHAFAARRIDDAAVALNGRVAFESLSLVGPRDIALRGVTFHPHRVAPAQDPVLIHVERVVVSLGLRGNGSGLVRVARVVVEGPDVTLRVDATGGPHADWLAWIANAASRRARPTGEAAERLPRDAAIVELVDGTVALDDPRGVMPSAGARLEHVTIDLDRGAVSGSVVVEGLGRGRVEGAFGAGSSQLSLALVDRADILPLLPVPLRAGRDARLTVARVDVDWPPRLTLGGVEARGLDARLPGGATLDRIAAATVSVSLAAHGALLDAVDIDVGFAGAAAPIAVQRAIVEHTWQTGEVAVAANLDDATGGRAAVVAEHDPGAGASSVRVTATRFDVAPIFDALSRAEGVRVEGRFSGTAQLTAEHASLDAQLSVDGNIAQAGLHLPVLSGTPILGVDVELDARAQLAAASRTLRLERSRVYLPSLGLFMVASGSVAADHFDADLVATLSRRPASQIAAALPSGIAEAFDGFSFDGELGFDARVHIDSADANRTTASFVLDAETFRVTQFGPRAPIDRMLDPDFAWPVRTWEGTTRSVGPGADGWTTLASLAPLTPRAIVAAEDDRFYVHRGLDPNGILAALRMNVAAGQIVRGGSTISQQVVKNLFLSHERSLSRKVLEAFLTWQLEQHLPKDRVLEYYVNIAHWGRGVYGLGEAARAYFQRGPSQLTLRESVFLAAILPNPNVFGGQYLDGMIAPTRRIKMRHILENLHRGGFISEATLRFNSDLVERGEISTTSPNDARAAWAAGGPR